MLHINIEYCTFKQKYSAHKNLSVIACWKSSILLHKSINAVERKTFSPFIKQVNTNSYCHFLVGDCFFIYLNHIKLTVQFKIIKFCVTIHFNTNKPQTGLSSTRIHKVQRTTLISALVTATRSRSPLCACPLRSGDGERERERERDREREREC